MIHDRYLVPKIECRRKTMLIGVPKEIKADERRVSMVPSWHVGMLKGAYPRKRTESIVQNDY